VIASAADAAPAGSARQAKQTSDDVFMTTPRFNVRRAYTTSACAPNAQTSTKCEKIDFANRGRPFAPDERSCARPRSLVFSHVRCIAATNLNAQAGISPMGRIGENAEGRSMGTRRFGARRDGARIDRPETPAIIDCAGVAVH
jgi:hypothetical protein